MKSISRRNFLSIGAVAAGSQALPRSLWADAPPAAVPGRPILKNGGGPGRGIAPKLKGEELFQARLTPESWQVEIIGDQIEKPFKFENGTALDYATLVELGKKHGVKYLKAMQCRSASCPSGHAIWEGIPLREVVRLLGKVGDVMRVYFNGYHDPSNPKSHFHSSSASFTQVMENAPGEMPILLAYRHNGVPVPLSRGGPVRVIVPWGYGFKSVKWLQRLRLTTNHNVTGGKEGHTYGGDPDSYMKTMAWPEGPLTFKAGAPIVVWGSASCGLSGLKRVEYWLRPDAGNEGRLPNDDPAWETAAWQPCIIDPPPDDWKPYLPAGISSKELWGFDPQTGKPKEWPLRYGITSWSAALPDLQPGAYELRARSVDQNDFAQPEPRPQRGSGGNAIMCKIIKVTR